MEVVIGIDIGGTNTKIGILNKNGDCLGELAFKTQNGHDTFDDYIETLHGKIKTVVNGKSDFEIKGIGIGAPNGNYFTGTIEDAPNLKWKGILKVTSALKKKTGIENIKLTNDANAAAIGEMVFGKAIGAKDFVVITLGTGLGSGIVTGGKLLLGHDGFAGEIGHMIVKEDGRLCGCGRKGCLETYVSATGIVKTVKEILLNSDKKSILRNVPDETLTSKLIAEAAGNNDEVALEAFKITSDILGKALANVVSVLSPEAIILFGGLSNSGDLIIKPTKKVMEENLMSIYKDKVKIILSGLNKGASAAVLGAAALIWNEG